ncbi:MAG: ATP-dependent helicase, partial [Planctomycetaceae bacterium]
HKDGPLLVLAGPGSGKTRVITRRIARLVERGVSPGAILAITFTNKAAGEMAERVAALLPGTRVWVSTFHKFCSRILRRRGEIVGLASNFTIYDTADQQQLLREILRARKIDATHYPPGRIAARISNAKNDLITAEEYGRGYRDRVGDHMQAVIAEVYPAYQLALLEANAVDFDDLLLHVVHVLTENPEIRRDLDERFRYVLVDEYQDTNLAQYQIVRALSQDHPNLCVTGDPDQSIYGWRGAQIENILRFERDYPRAAVVRLEENFRSTKGILRAADSLISHNTLRKAKSLVTDNPQGAPPRLLTFYNETQEAETIAAEIRRQVEAGARNWSDFGVFYRVNALSRRLEHALGRARVPFQVAAGLSFYERAEIKDLLGYLRLVLNPADVIAFRRVVNTPARGIGKTTQDRLHAWAEPAGLSLLEACRRAGEMPGASKRAAKALAAFAEMIDEFSRSAAGPVEALLRRVIDRTGYVRAWQDSQSEEDAQHLANVEELLTAAHQYDHGPDETPSLEGFLETTSLTSDVDSVDETAGRVTLMTLHAAKGLEFPAVYIIAVEHNLLPHERSLRDRNLAELEEERRLLFVGMTRAMQQLALTQTWIREFRGRRSRSIPSEFLREMELEQVDHAEPLVEQTAWDGDAASADAPDADGDEDSAPAVRDEPPVSRSAGRPHLTTGAELLNGTAGRASLPQGFCVGMLVRHPQYGPGRVVDVGGFGPRRTATVEFDDGHRQTFIQSMSPLQPIGPVESE